MKTDREEWFRRHGSTKWERNEALRQRVKAKREREEVKRLSGPVKQFTPEELAAFAQQRGLRAAQEPGGGKPPANHGAEHEPRAADGLGVRDQQRGSSSGSSPKRESSAVERSRPAVQPAINLRGATGRTGTWPGTNSASPAHGSSRPTGTGHCPVLAAGKDQGPPRSTVGATGGKADTSARVPGAGHTYRRRRSGQDGTP